MSFGEKLKNLRVDANLSQSELASKIGVTRRTVIYYESGQRYPKTRDIIMKISSLFKVSADYLVSDREDFVMQAGEKYGEKGKREAIELVDEIGALFAGGSLNDSDKDKVFRAISEIYWESKDINKKYADRSDNN